MNGKRGKKKGFFLKPVAYILWGLQKAHQGRSSPPPIKHGDAHTQTTHSFRILICSGLESSVSIHVNSKA